MIVAEEFEGQVTCLEENTKNDTSFSAPIEKEVIRIDKKGKLQKTYLTDYNLLIAQGLQKAHYQISLIILLKEFIKLNVNTDTMKKIKTCEIKYKNCFLEYINYKDDFIEYKCLCCNKNYPKNFDENLKKWFF